MTRMASGNQALLIAQHDRPPLVRGEHPVAHHDPDDAALVGEHALDRPRAAGVRRDGRGHRRLDAGMVAQPEPVVRSDAVTCTTRVGAVPPRFGISS